jgi:competence protein ComFA
MWGMGVAAILFYRYFLSVMQKENKWLVTETPCPEESFGVIEGRVAVSDRTYPLGIAVRLVRELQNLVASKPEITLMRLDGWGRRVIRQAQDYPPPRFTWIYPEFREMPVLNEEQRGLLAGRLLSGIELSGLMRQYVDWSPGEWERWLQQEIMHGRADRRPGVGRDRLGRVVCNRCGETEFLQEQVCHFCGGRCYVCLACQCFGPARECLPLYHIYSRGLVEPPGEIVLNMPALTPIQELAAGKVRDFYRDGRGEFLVWAVCGAGKTEVVYPALREALLAGERVLYAVPRRDVVREMGQRFARAFPGLKINVLHGGEGRIETPDAPLTVATTHQVLRFIAHFDLAVLDEADAYPYEGSRMLHFGLRRAVRPTGRIVMMTATPDAELRQKVAEGKLGCVRIPGRHHGRPLPVPVLMEDELPVGLWQAGGSLPPVVRRHLVDWAERMLPVLIFLPTVGAVESFGRFLQQVPELKPIPLDWVHAGHPHRDRIVEEFRSGKLRMMVTTTVLERGLNFPGVQVMVLHADDERVFDTECLVQIAGRVGRYASHPGGEVVFIGCKISRAMLEAEKWIREMNKEAKQAGLLDDFTSF